MHCDVRSPLIFPNPVVHETLKFSFYGGREARVSWWHVTKEMEEEDEPGETRRGHQAAEAVLLEMEP